MLLYEWSKGEFHMSKLFQEKCDGCGKRSQGNCEHCANVLLNQAGLRSNLEPCGKQQRNERVHYVALSTKDAQERLVFYP